MTLEDIVPDSALVEDEGKEEEEEEEEEEGVAEIIEIVGRESKVELERVSEEDLKESL